MTSKITYTISRRKENILLELEEEILDVVDRRIESSIDHLRDLRESIRNEIEEMISSAFEDIEEIEKENS